MIWPPDTYELIWFLAGAALALFLALLVLALCHVATQRRQDDVPMTAQMEERLVAPWQADTQKFPAYRLDHYRCTLPTRRD